LFVRRVALCFVAACAADRGASIHPTPHATASAAASATSAGAPVDAGPKEWMWQLVGGAREVHWRWPDGTCEMWRVDPDGAPAEYRGTLFRALDSYEMQMTYEGDPPKVRAPRVVEERANDAGTTKVELVCRGEDQAAWYLDADACAAGGAPPLTAKGCFASIAPDARANVSRVMRGEVRAELESAIAHAHFVWTYNGCTKRTVRTRNRKLYMNDGYLYPTLVRFTQHGVTLEEEAEPNPDHVAPRGGGEEIAIGCCSIERYTVVAFDHGVADMKSERWYIDKAPPADVVARCGKKP
jgi:hypothetical protein